MKKADYNIEFAHIYAHETFSGEQIKSTEILKKIISKLQKDKKTFVTSVLIDEFHSVVFRLYKKKLIEKLEQQGVNIDFIGYESRLGNTSEKLIQEIPKSRLKIEESREPDKRTFILTAKDRPIALKEEFEFAHKYTCALLSASWSLCRLGVFSIPTGAIDNLYKKPFEAKRIVTILPRKYKSVEDKVIEIIKSTKFKPVIQGIEYEFF